MEKFPRLTVDAVVLRENRIILVKRKNPPFQGVWAIPGGFVDFGETVENAVIREGKEETSLDLEIDRLFGVYSDPERDPRGHTISLIYLCREVGGNLKASDDAADAREFPLDDLPPMAFDHKKIIEDLKATL